MLPIQPPFIGAYFNEKNDRQRLPDGVYRKGFLSWEDGLWYLLQLHRVPKNSTVLVPEFFCGNVVEHMVEHGLRVVFYPVDAKLHTPIEAFIRMLQVERPRIVVIFHAVGITNELWQQSQKWLPQVVPETVLIEDSVHRIVSPEQLQFLHPHHYVMDSLRKVLPLQGSMLYSARQLPDLRQVGSDWWYRWRVLGWWMVMQAGLVTAYYSRSKRLAQWGNLLAEKSMLRGYELIGKHQAPAAGFSLMEQRLEKITPSKLKAVKPAQVMMYVSTLNNAKFQKWWQVPPFSENDRRELRGFPLVLKRETASDLLAYLREAGITLRFELNDSPWSERHKIIYLPLGIHVTKRDIETVIQRLLHWPGLQ